MLVVPFRAIRYSETVAGDVAKVICRPYDVITSEQQRLYYGKSDYSAVRLEFPEPIADRYQIAAMTFRQWLEQGVLQYDGVAGFYLHEHEFKYSGRKMLRRGVIARVKLEPWGKGVLPHEETASKAKTDRLKLMRACRANFSPLLALYEDSERRISAVLRRVAEEGPVISLPAERSDFPDPDEAHRVWAVADPDVKRDLSDLLSAQAIYIADGHHRYETALTYRQERIGGASPGDSGASEYVMMELVEFSDSGLVILPLHRLVRGISPSCLVSLMDRLKDFFNVEVFALGTGSWHLPVGSCLGVLGPCPGSLTVLNRRQDFGLETMMPSSRSQTYRELGASILNHIAFEGVLSEAKDLEVAYTVDMEEARQQIEEGKYQLAFLLHAPRVEMLKAVADARDRMPAKSTYFYPKVPAGLVINPLD
jgi:uncharacterized protein (DUF1015 family)